MVFTDPEKTYGSSEVTCEEFYMGYEALRNMSTPPEGNVMRGEGQNYKYLGCRIV